MTQFKTTAITSTPVKGNMMTGGMMNKPAAKAKTKQKIKPAGTVADKFVKKNAQEEEKSKGGRSTKAMTYMKGGKAKKMQTGDQFGGASGAKAYEKMKAKNAAKKKKTLDSTVTAHVNSKSYQDRLKKRMTVRKGSKSDIQKPEAPKKLPNKAGEKAKVELYKKGGNMGGCSCGGEMKAAGGPITATPLQPKKTGTIRDRKSPFTTKPKKKKRGFIGKLKGIHDKKMSMLPGFGKKSGIKHPLKSGETKPTLPGVTATGKKNGVNAYKSTGPATAGNAKVIKRTYGEGGRIYLNNQMF